LSGEVAPVPGGQSAFGDRYEVIVASPLPEFDTHGGNAYSAKDKQNPGADVFAMVHNPTVPIRNELFKGLKGRPVINMVNPVDRGLMNVNIGSAKQRLVTIFTRPTGGALMNADGTLHPRMNANRLRQNVVLAALKAFAALHKRGYTHRMISPTRMYFASSESDEVILGECYSSPAGYLNPFPLEALEVSFADDAVRGVGDFSCDYYQLGTSLQSLYFGEKLWDSRDRNSLMMARINQGSFGALSGGRDIPGALGTLIRGLMADEPDERWNAEEVLDWFEGVSRNKRTSMITWTMSRPTTFKGVAYVDRRLLADAFGKDPKEAANFLKTMDFSSWLQTCFRDEIFSERLEFALDVRPSEGFGGARADDYKMVSRVCMFLSPAGPLYYKGHSLMLSGIPTLVADAFARDDHETMTTLLEIFDGTFVSALVEIAGDKNPKLQSLFKDIGVAMEFGSGKQLGRGLERMLYELNPILPCLSPRFEKVWIGSLVQLIRALERVSAQGGGKNILLDRHVAAFCVTHGSNLDRDFNSLAASQHNPAIFNSLSTEFFGRMQKQLQLESLPALLEKLVDGLAPVVKNLKNKKRREHVQATLDKLKKSGDINKLCSEVNLSKVQALDAREFSQACNIITKLDREKIKLSKKIEPTDSEPRKKGYNGARTAAFVMFVLIGFLVFFRG